VTSSLFQSNLVRLLHQLKNAKQGKERAEHFLKTRAGEIEKLKKQEKEKQKAIEEIKAVRESLCACLCGECARQPAEIALLHFIHSSRIICALAVAIALGLYGGFGFRVR